MADGLILSTLPKTWIFDLDGTIVRHNGYLNDGGDTLLPGVKIYLNAIPEEDFILILTARTEEYRDITLRFLQDNGIRYNAVLFGLPAGERIVINDRKLTGIDMAFAVNSDRNRPVFPKVDRIL